LKTLLGEKSWEALKAENETLPVDISTVKDIDLQIYELCGSDTIDEFIGAKRAVLNEYKSKYVNEEELKKSIKSLENSVKESRGQPKMAHFNKLS
jgi:hypothetical protein